MATPQELVTAAKCFVCIPPGMQGAVRTYLLMQSAGLDMTPAELMEAAKCFTCIPDGMQAAVQTYLTEQIVVNGGGGGGGGTTIQFSAASDPSGVPIGNARVWVRLDSGKLWIYNTTNGNWDPYLG